MQHLSESPCPKCQKEPLYNLGLPPRVYCNDPDFHMKFMTNHPVVRWLLSRTQIYAVVVACGAALFIAGALMYVCGLAIYAWLWK